MIEGKSADGRTVQMRRFASNKRLANSIAAGYRERWPGCWAEVTGIPRRKWHLVDLENVETGVSEK